MLLENGDWAAQGVPTLLVVAQRGMPGWTMQSPVDTSKNWRRRIVFHCPSENGIDRRRMPP
jgi:hypothetical protein